MFFFFALESYVYKSNPCIFLGSSKTLFVKGVTEDMSKEELAKYFEDASEVRMITDRDTGKNKL